MPLRSARHISIGIDRPLEEVHGFLADPGNFPQWAKGLGHSFRHLDDLDWQVDTPLGAMRVRFSPPNSHGVLDHTLFPPDGAPIVNPMRVVANGDGCEVVFTLFRRDDMSETQFEQDAAWVLEDLTALKRLLES